jgi:hypothetical protein
MGLEPFAMLIQSSSPIIVRVIEQPAESTSVSDILIGALGLTGVLMLAAAVLGLLLGGALVGIKLLRARYNLEPVPDSESMRVTPTRL